MMEQLSKRKMRETKPQEFQKLSLKSIKMEDILMEENSKCFTVAYSLKHFVNLFSSNSDVQNTASPSELVNLRNEAQKFYQRADDLEQKLNSSSQFDRG